MTQQVELSLDTKCYLCDSFYANSQESFIVYKCFLCMKYTSYCLPCELKLQRLFGKGNFFKCLFCDKLTNALDKLEIKSPKSKLNINNSFFKTPSKPFMENNIPISSIRQNNHSNFFINNNEEERKDNNSNINNPNNIVISNFLNDFNKININLALNQKSLNNNKSISSINNNKNFPYKNINITDTTKGTNWTLTNSNSLSNFKTMNNFSLLTNKSRLNKRFCLNESLLGKKRDDSENASEYRQTLRSNNICTSRSRGKFKNLISIQMSKMYKNENNNNSFIGKNQGIEETLNEYRKKNCEMKNVFLSGLNSCNNNKDNNGFGFNLLRTNNKNSINPFMDKQREIINFSTIDGKATPHRISSNNNNSFEFF